MKRPSQLKQDIVHILNEAVNAPSGHNSQPWKFTVRHNEINLLGVPDKDKILFNYLERGSRIAQGALLENIRMIASIRGYSAQISLLPLGYNKDLIAKIVLTKKVIPYEYENLYSSIKKRATNRRPYAKKAFSTETQNKIRRNIDQILHEPFSINLISNRSRIRTAANAFSFGDRLIFDNHDVHQALFANVNWTLAEEKRKKEGLFLKTKELSPLNQILFKYVFSRWSIIRLLHGFNFSVLAAKKRERLYEQCASMGIIFAPDDTEKSFLLAGTLLERFWLSMTSMNIAFQPLSIGLLYLGQRMAREKPANMSAQEINYIKKAYQKVLHIFQVKKNRIPVFSFRLGYAEPPTAVSMKHRPEITFIP